MFFKPLKDQIRTTAGGLRIHEHLWAWRQSITEFHLLSHVFVVATGWISAPSALQLAVMNTFSPLSPEVSTLTSFAPFAVSILAGVLFHCKPISFTLKMRWGSSKAACLCTPSPGDQNNVYIFPCLKQGTLPPPT